MKALHFRAGNIGRGVIGKLLADAGVEVVFADVNQQVFDALNQRHQYQVRVVDEQAQVETVRGVSAVHSGSDDVVAAIASVDLVTPAVGPQILKRIAPAIARGLVKRHDGGSTQPLNIIACENMVRWRRAIMPGLTSMSALSIPPWTASCRWLKRPATTRWR